MDGDVDHNSGDDVPGGCVIIPKLDLQHDCMVLIESGWHNLRGVLTS